MPNDSNDELNALIARATHVTQACAAHLAAVRAAPEVTQQRESSWLEPYARLATRVRALEEGFEEMCNVVVSLFSLVRDGAGRREE
jgi:hypothetical protein